MAQVFLRHVRVAFIDRLWTPGEYEAGDTKFRRSATFIIDPDSDNAKNVKEAMFTVAKDQWKERANNMLEELSKEKGKFCVQKNKKTQSGEIYDGFEDKLALTANRAEKQGPVLVVARDGRTVLGEGSGVIYGGCYVNANVEIYTQVGKHTGVRCSLLGVQFDADGEAFTGGSGPIEAFKNLDEGADAGEVEEEVDEEVKAAFNF